MLFALLILAVMAAIGFVISSLVYREVSVSRVFDDSLHSYYAAETGVERGLDIVALHRTNNETLAGTLTAIENYATSASPLSLAAGNGSYAIDTTLTSSTDTTLEVPIVDLYQIDLYDPDNSISSLMNAESLRMYWNLPASCSSSSRVELTYREFSSGAFGLDDDAVYKQVYTCGVETPPTGYDCQATSNWPAANTNYTIQIRSFDCGYIDATIGFYESDNASGAPVEIPSLVNIAAVGSGNLSQREIVARTKWVPSSSGLSAFVLFSLEAIAH